MTSRSASCACGQLTAVCEGEPEFVSLCHCTQCQRRTGSAFGVAAFFRKPRVEVTGKSSEYSRPADSGHSVTFHFCPQCGSSVLWKPSRLPDYIAVAAGAFGDPSFPAPDKAVFSEHRHHWLGTGDW